MLTLKRLPGRLRAVFVQKERSDTQSSSQSRPFKQWRRSSVVSKGSSQDSDATLLDESQLDARSNNTILDDSARRCSSPTHFEPQKTEKRWFFGKKREGITSVFMPILDIAVSIGEATNIPYLKNVAGILKIVLTNVQSTKNNREQCERIWSTVSEITTLVQENAKKSGDDSPQYYKNNQALERCCNHINSALQKCSKRKYLVRLSNAKRDEDLLNDCEREMNKALRLFQARACIRVAAGVKKKNTLDEEFRDTALEVLRSAKEQMRCPQVEVPAAPGPSQIFEFQLQDRLYELPPSPQIFHGRSEEIQRLVSALVGERQSHAVICGSFGVGKSCLAQRLMHLPEIERVFGYRRYFVGCERVKALDDLKMSLAELLVTPPPPKDQVLRVLSQCDLAGDRCLLVLDNLESTWESSDTRLIVEDFLTELSCIPGVSLVVTLRGTQRPLGPDWSKPYLPPLSPFCLESARNTFLAVSGLVPGDDLVNLDSLLEAVEYLPLAVTSIARLAQYELLEFLRERFEEEGVSMLFLDDGESDLETALRGLLANPRVGDCPHALDVFRELCSYHQRGSGSDSDSNPRISLLPRTRVVEELVEELKVQAVQVQRCISVLIHASLVREDRRGGLAVSPLMWRVVN